MTRIAHGYNISTDALLSALVWLGMDEKLRPFITTSEEEEVTECSPAASTPTKNEQ